MSPLAYRDGQLYVDGVAACELADRYGTPCYVYSERLIQSNWSAADGAFSGRRHLICYSVKANSNLAILQLLARAGSGFDIVSAGELERVLAAGGSAAKTVFAGVGKQRWELERALDAGVRCISVESLQELETLSELARARAEPAPVALRVNPDVDAKTHPYIATGLEQNKFGIPAAQAREIYLDWRAWEGIEFIGIGSHIGSQITSTAPFADALRRIAGLGCELREAGLPLRHIDIGGGLGIRYRDETPPSFEQWAGAVEQAVPDPDWELLIDPGRSIVGAAGILLTRVEYLKHNVARNFAVVDAAMNDLLRPALYGAWHEVLPACPRDEPAVRYDIVGPVCETADFIAKDRSLALLRGDLLAVKDVGAYGFVMSSTYNSRPRPPEILIRAGEARLIRRRETVADLMALETPADA